MKDGKFKPHDQVLVRVRDVMDAQEFVTDTWKLKRFSHISLTWPHRYVCLDGSRWLQCIPYTGNEELLGSNVHPQFGVLSTDIETLKSIVGSVQHHVKQAETAWKSAKVDLEYIQDALSKLMKY